MFGKEEFASFLIEESLSIESLKIQNPTRRFLKTRRNFPDHIKIHPCLEDLLLEDLIGNS